MKLINKKWILCQASILVLFLLASGNLVRYALASANPGEAPERSGRNRMIHSPTTRAADQSIQALELLVSERYPQLPPGEQQEFQLNITQSGIPVAGIQAQLTLILPNSLGLYLFPPTSDTGEANLQIAPLVMAPGSLIRYDVCVFLNDKSNCTQREFVIVEVSR
jgi:hypothetical protein